MSTIKRNGALASEPREDKERKRSELEERLSEVRRRSESQQPAAASPPPVETPPPPPAASHPAHRLDMLLGK